MGELRRWRTTWSGFAGAPGISTFYGDNAESGPDQKAAIAAFWAAIEPYVPHSVTLTLLGNGDVVDDISGDVTGVFSEGSDSAVVGGNSGYVMAPAGALVQWLTGVYLRGRQLRGKTFLVPLGATEFTDTGALSASVAAAIQSAGTTMLAAGDGDMFRVWHRPTTSPATAGESHSATTCLVTTKCVVLRSRRD